MASQSVPVVEMTAIECHLERSLRLVVVPGLGQAVLVITDPKDQPANVQNAVRIMHLARTLEQQMSSNDVRGSIANSTCAFGSRMAFIVPLRTRCQFQSSTSRMP